MSGDRGSVSGVLVCWSLDLGLTPDGSLSFSFPLAFFGLCKSTSKENTSLPGQLRYFNYSSSPYQAKECAKIEVEVQMHV